MVVSFEEILSLTDIVSDEIFNVIVDSKAWLETIEDYITVIDKPCTPDEIENHLRSWNAKFGKFVQLENGLENYVPHNRELIKISILDHVKLIKGGNKQAIDQTCDHYIYYRNKCNITGIFVQQANRQSKAMDRRLNGWNSPPYAVMYIENFFNCGELSCRKSAAKICYFDIFFVLLIKN